MRDFHAYPLDDAGKIVGRKDFASADDADAMRIARHLYPGMALEVWCGARIVAKLERHEAPSQLRMFRDAN
jgi:hypothetical protein